MFTMFPEVTGIMGGTRSGLDEYTQAFSEAVSSLCDNATMAAWANFQTEVHASLTFGAFPNDNQSRR